MRVQRIYTYIIDVDKIASRVAAEKPFTARLPYFYFSLPWPVRKPSRVQPRRAISDEASRKIDKKAGGRDVYLSPLGALIFLLFLLRI